MEEIAERPLELLPLENPPLLFPSPIPIFNINVEEFKQMLAAQIDLNSLYILCMLNNGIDVLKELSGAKVKGWYQTLERKGFVLDGKITEAGKNLINLVNAGTTNLKQEVVKMEKERDDSFEKWWFNFPSNDIFTHKGRSFSGGRGFRVNKEKCRSKFYAILAEGEYTLEDMLRALKYEIDLRKENSLKEGQNKLQYLSGTEPYLNQRKFEAFMEISKTDVIKQAKSTPYSGFDI